MEAAGQRYIVHPSRRFECLLWGLGDFHLGNKGADKERLARDINEIKSAPNSFWVGTGDYADYINPHDRRWDAEIIDPRLISINDLSSLGKVLTRAVQEQIEPIKHKCLGLLLGNHEYRYMREQEQEDLHAWLCQELGVPNLRYSAIFDIQFVRHSTVKQPTLLDTETGKKLHGSKVGVRVFVHHGAGSANTPGGRQNRLVNFMSFVEADIIIAAHMHTNNTAKAVRLGANFMCTRIIEKQQVGVLTGGYLRGYPSGISGYPERAGKAPVPIGASKVLISVHWPRTGRVEVSIRALV